jgi:IS30 family transposase
MASRPKATKLATTPVLRDLVQARLLEGLSPEEISGELKKRFPHDPAMRVSHETIYRSIYLRGRGALRTSRRKRA